MSRSPDTPSGPRPDFWAAARYPKFASAKPKVLMLRADYFLYREIARGLDMLGVEHRAVDIPTGERGSTTFIETLLAEVLRFKPDFALTVNHMGLDREGKLAELLDRLGLPLASWFVDNPRLILHRYAHPGADNVSVFTFDAGNMRMLAKRGFAAVHYLPLATDPTCFRPAKGLDCPAAWQAKVAFVGNSMAVPVAKCRARAALPPAMNGEYREVATEFGASGQLSVQDFLAESRPEWLAELESMDDPEQALALESLLTWEATRQYRLACVSGLNGFEPLIVGDKGWEGQLPGTGWRRLDSLDYYADLPRFYQCPIVNFNATSKQMKGAVNQRLFDVPASGGFLLTDRREQLEDLFEPGSEVGVYDDPDQVPELLARWLGDEQARKAVIKAGRKRVLAEHTYRHRLETLLDCMARTHAGVGS